MCCAQDCAKPAIFTHIFNELTANKVIHEMLALRLYVNHSVFTLISVSLHWLNSAKEGQTEGKPLNHQDSIMFLLLCDLLLISETVSGAV